MTFIKFQNILFEYFLSRLLKKWIKNDFIPNNYKFFIENKEIKDWGSTGNLYFENLNSLHNTLRATEKEIFELKCFDYYQGYVGARMNNLLRGVKSYLDNDSLNEYIECIQKTLSKFKIEDNIVVIRRTNANFFIDFKTNSIFIEHGFLSTSINLSHREDSDGNKKPLKDEALLFLKIPSKTCALYTEAVQEERRRRNEFELLIQRGSKIKIEKNYVILSNRIILGTLQPNFSE